MGVVSICVFRIGFDFCVSQLQRNLLKFLDAGRVLRIRVNALAVEKAIVGVQSGIQCSIAVELAKKIAVSR